MYYFDKYDVTLDIRLDPGVYIFTGYSATGKTYLAHKLEEYHLFGEPVCAYSYNEYTWGLSLESVLANADMKVIVLDL